MILTIIMTISCFPQPRGSTARRVEALYDCQADHHDELSFSEGQVLVVLGQEDSDWWVSITSLHPDWGSQYLFMVTYCLNSDLVMQKVRSTYKTKRSVTPADKKGKISSMCVCVCVQHGYIEDEPEQRGLFPSSFVQLLLDWHEVDQDHHRDWSRPQQSILQAQESHTTSTPDRFCAAEARPLLDHGPGHTSRVLLTPHPPPPTPQGWTLLVQTTSIRWVCVFSHTVGATSISCFLPWIH